MQFVRRDDPSPESRETLVTYRFPWTHHKRGKVPGTVQHEGKTYYFKTGTLVTPELAEQRKRIGAPWKPSACEAGYWGHYTDSAFWAGR